MKVYNPIINYFFESYLRSGEHPMKQQFVSYINRLFNYRGVISSTMYNFEMLLDLRDIVQNRIFFERTWEPLLSEYIDNELNKDDVFYDVGGNVGYFSLLAAKKKAQVVTFEPDPKNVAIIEYHKEINNFQDIDVRNFGLGDKDESLEFFRASIGNNGLSGFTSRNTVDNFFIPVHTIDTLVYEQNLPKPTFIKIDTEGWEQKILRGALRLLKNDPPKTIIFESDPIANNFEDDFYIIKELLDNHNYQITKTLNDEFGINHVAEYKIK